MVSDAPSGEDKSFKAKWASERKGVCEITGTIHGAAVVHTGSRNPEAIYVSAHLKALAAGGNSPTVEGVKVVAKLEVGAGVLDGTLREELGIPAPLLAAQIREAANSNSNSN